MNEVLKTIAAKYKDDIVHTASELIPVSYTHLDVYKRQIDLGVVRLAANYSIFRNFLYF